MLRFIICEDNKEFNSRISEIINKVMMSYNFEYKLNNFFEYNKEVEQVIFLNWTSSQPQPARKIIKSDELLLISFVFIN